MRLWAGDPKDSPVPVVDVDDAVFVPRKAISIFKQPTKEIKWKGK